MNDLIFELSLVIVVISLSFDANASGTHSPDFPEHTRNTTVSDRIAFTPQGDA